MGRMEESGRKGRKEEKGRERLPPLLFKIKYN